MMQASWLRAASGLLSGLAQTAALPTQQCRPCVNVCRMIRHTGLQSIVADTAKMKPERGYHVGNTFRGLGTLFVLALLVRVLADPIKRPQPSVYPLPDHLPNAGYRFDLGQCALFEVSFVVCVGLLIVERLDARHSKLPRWLLPFLSTVRFLASFVVTTIRLTTQKRHLYGLGLMYPDIGGIGVRVGIEALVLFTLVSLLIGRFRFEPCGTKELGIWQLTSMALIDTSIRIGRHLELNMSQTCSIARSI